MLKANFPQYNCTFLTVDAGGAAHSSSAQQFLGNGFYFVWLQSELMQEATKLSAAVCHCGLLTTCCQPRDETCSVTGWFTRRSAPMGPARSGCYGASSRVWTSRQVFLCNRDFYPTDKYMQPIPKHQRHFMVNSSFLLMLSNIVIYVYIQTCFEVSVNTNKYTHSSDLT